MTCTLILSGLSFVDPERERESEKRKEGGELHPSVLAITKDIWHIESRSSSYHMCLS